MNNMRPMIEALLDKDTVIFFDFDGVLGSFEYGERTHAACKDEKWESYVVSHKPYENECMPFKVIQDFIKKKDADKVFVLTCVGGPAEAGEKRLFAMRHYGIPFDNFIAVNHKVEKLPAMREVHHSRFPNLKEEQLALVEDTVETLNQVFNESNYMTVHVTSLFVDASENSCGDCSRRKWYMSGYNNCMSAYGFTEDGWHRVYEKDYPKIGQDVWATIVDVDGNRRVAISKFLGTYNESDVMGRWEGIGRYEGVLAWLPYIVPKVFDGLR